MAVKNADANGSSVALTKNMDKASREATSAMRASWKLYYVASFAETFGEALRLPSRDVGAWERALCDPINNLWIVELYLRVWLKKHDERAYPPGTQSRGLLLIPGDWEREERRVLPRATKRVGVEYDVDARGGFLECDPMDRLDILHAVCDEVFDRKEWSADFVSRSAERLERANARADKATDAKKRANAFRDVDRGVHGESIGRDAKGCSYYVTANDARLYRSSPTSTSAPASGSAAGAPDGWCAPFVSLEEVAAFARSMKKTTNRREKALYEYLVEDHIPFHEARLKRLEEARAEAKKKEEADRAAKEKREEQRRRIELLEKTAKRSSRIGEKKAAQETVAVRDREPETISFDRRKEVLEDLRRWLLTPPSLRESAEPPHDVKREALLVETRAIEFRMPMLKPRGRAWRGWCVRVCGDDADPSDEKTWSDAVCVDYDAGRDKVRVYHLETATMEFVNMDAVPVRMGYVKVRMNELFDKKGRALVSSERLRRECGGLCASRTHPIVEYAGSWRDHIVGEGVPSYGDDDDGKVAQIMLHVQHHDDVYAELDGEFEPELYESETETETDVADEDKDDDVKDAEKEEDDDDDDTVEEATELDVESDDKTIEQQTEDDDEETNTTVVLDDDVPASE